MANADTTIKVVNGQRATAIAGVVRIIAPLLVASGATGTDKIPLGMNVWSPRKPHYLETAGSEV